MYDVTIQGDRKDYALFNRKNDVWIFVIVNFYFLFWILR